MRLQSRYQSSVKMVILPMILIWFDLKNGDTSCDTSHDICLSWSHNWDKDTSLRPRWNHWTLHTCWFRRHKNSLKPPLRLLGIRVQLLSGMREFAKYISFSNFWDFSTVLSTWSGLFLRPKILKTKLRHYTVCARKSNIYLFLKNGQHMKPTWAVPVLNLQNIIRYRSNYKTSNTCDSIILYNKIEHVLMDEVWRTFILHCLLVYSGWTYSTIYFSSSIIFLGYIQFANVMKGFQSWSRKSHQDSQFWK